MRVSRFDQCKTYSKKGFYENYWRESELPTGRYRKRK
jgi:hypothetical protein